MTTKDTSAPLPIRSDEIAKCPGVDLEQLRETLKTIDGLRRLGVEAFDRPYSLMPPLDSAFGRRKPTLGTAPWPGARASG